MTDITILRKPAYRWCDICHHISHLCTCMIILIVNNWPFCDYSGLWVVNGNCMRLFCCWNLTFIFNRCRNGCPHNIFSFVFSMYFCFSAMLRTVHELSVELSWLWRSKSRVVQNLNQTIFSNQCFEVWTLNFGK